MLALFAFVGSTTFGSTVKLSDDVCISIDCDKCGKTDCKGECSHDKKACKKKGGKCCKGDKSADGEKKACCKKGEEKACCKKGKKEDAGNEESPATPEKE